MTHKFEYMIWQFVRETFVSMVIFALSITYKNWTLVDAWVKKDRHLENKKMLLSVQVTFLIA